MEEKPPSVFPKLQLPLPCCIDYLWFPCPCDLRLGVYVGVMKRKSHHKVRGDILRSSVFSVPKVGLILDFLIPVSFMCT